MNDAPTGRRRPGLRLALTLSVALNGLAAGYLIGHGLETPPPTPQAATAVGFGERLKLLPREERQKFQQAMQASRPAIQQARQAWTEARAGIAAAMAEEPYDADRMRQAFAVARTAGETLQGRVQEATAQALAGLSPQSRQQLARP